MRKNFADTRNISAVLAKAGVPERPPAALGRGTARKDDFAVTENTLISAVLARAGLPLRPPAALGRASWLDVHVQTVGQLSAALRAEAAPQRGAAPGRTSLLDLQNVGQLSAALRGQAKPQPQPWPQPSAPLRVSRNTIGGLDVPPLQQQQSRWAKHKEDVLRERQRREKKALSPKLAALQAMIDAILAAMHRALLSGDLITYAVLSFIMVKLRGEYDKQAAREAAEAARQATETGHESAEER